MKFSLLRGPLSPARARNCAIINQLATPGLGSLMGRRFIAGGGQLTLAIAGFTLFCAWFVDVVRGYYSMMDSDAPPHPHHWLAFAGVGLFALAWIWALLTSFSLLREARRNEREGKLMPEVPPILTRDQ